MANSSGDVRGIIPAGVHPWGDSCLDEIMPRVLLPVIGTPLIAHSIEWLRGGGVSSIVVCANSASPRVRAALGAGDHLSVELSYYDDLTPRGPAGCVRDAATLTDGERFVVVDGTVLPGFALSEMLDAHVHSGAAATVAVRRDRGDGSQRDQLAPLGVYIFERRAVESVPDTGYQDSKEVLIPKLHESGEPVLPYIVDSVFPRVSDASSYLAATEWMLSNYLRDTTPPRGFRRRGNALVHVSASVSPRAKLVGPALIGPRSDVDDEAVLIGPLVVGSDCHVGSRTALCRTVLWNSCRIGGDGYLDNCIVTSDVTLPAAARHYGTLLTTRGPSSEISIRGGQAGSAGGSSRIWDIRGGNGVAGTGTGGQRAARSVSRSDAPVLS
jgi:NDP-sugar pyrophosphorylase family protein